MQKAIEKLEEETEAGEKQWNMLKENHINDVTRCQDAMQQSECVCWQHLARAGFEHKKGVGSSSGGGGQLPIEHD